MSLVRFYARADLATARLLCTDHHLVLDADKRLTGVEVINVDQANIALSWLISPLQRAEHAYLGRLIADPDWSDEEIRIRRAELDAIPVEDALCAVMGWTGEAVVPDATQGISAGGYFLAPRRVRSLSAALAAITADGLRAELDFKALDEGLVPPDGWLDEGEDIFACYVLPALEKLKAFYRAAVQNGQAVLILMA